ncbi:MAG: histidinol-phosphatase HisJ family protein [Lachnospiraceae bacterium]|nr:histidinol-phosphatase HisJ family protein [Lachnospiraceae bacterium]
MILSDQHMHSSFSTDSQSDPRLLCDTAISRGLTSITITDHMDCEWPEDNTQYIFDEKEYFDVLGKLRADYSGRIDLGIGMEFGFRNEADIVEKIDKRFNELKVLPFDFIIGSTHLYDYGDPYYPKFWEGHNAYRRLMQYYEATLFNVEHYDSYDVYGHLDYAVRYVPADTHIEPTRFLNIIEVILKKIIEDGHGLEINTKNLNKGFSVPNPSPTILKMYRAMGGEIITVGSDAHKPEHVGGCFDKARDILLDCGFKHYAVFRAHKPEFYEL